MKAFILAAGLGTRLKDLTKDLPKPLLKVKGKSLIEWNILKLKRAGFEHIIINTHYLGDLIEDHIGNGEKFNLKISYSREEEILGTGGALIKAKDLIGRETFLILSGDLWTDYPFSRLINYDLKKKAHLILLKKGKEKEADMNLKNDYIFVDKNSKELTYSGIGLINPKIYEGIKIDKLKLWKDLLLPLVSKQEISGEVYNGLALNINLKKDLEELDVVISEG
ncbi:sugar phosphate nucleotidyltransferase [SAR86 cluster bacterium]|jgi:MurNAc alpha-1-phosphate uridylyltransferase|nr:sugar phosphate nucleotidyltransferase [SAR86 cluster bacterium]